MGGRPAGQQRRPDTPGGQPCRA
ncbi:hypothetical protein SM139_0232, partial [Stenotrophomonas maltophilia]